MKVKSQIESKIRESLRPVHLEVMNESSMHSVPPGSESHFKVVIASDSFIGKNLVDRHRMLYQLLERELREGVHALALQTFTPEEWKERQSVPASPPCLGGKK